MAEFLVRGVISSLSSPAGFHRHLFMGINEFRRSKQSPFPEATTQQTKPQFPTAAPNNEARQTAA